ncbi:hypothetical protein [Terracoccus luteus]|uniref:Uncharacterized protein n=1 Tax=Terracoccus luteus TaxID=53356 RepID=A0A839Q3J8_9MICO|nr:hypothetical protein [Terracoccus luteus]MBB2987211.1 hypothetical protein [Terracoccus luteus]MCP2172862.1 hypothetical protein [Terracoccus luteus]
MLVVFARIGVRRYEVRVHRELATDLLMSPAPGWNDLVPHDLVHLVVEHRFGLRDGIFGQLAAGGNAWTFVPTQEQRTRAWARRVERRNRARGTQIGRSEQLASAVLPVWLRRRGLAPDPAHAAATSTLPEGDLDTRDLELALADLDELSTRWQALAVGGSVEVEWPWPETGTTRP